MRTDYRKYVEEGSQSGVLHRELITRVKLIPLHIQHVLANQHAHVVAWDNDGLLRAVQQHYEYVGDGDGPPRDLAKEVKIAAKMRPGGVWHRRGLIQWR